MRKRGGPPGSGAAPAPTDHSAEVRWRPVDAIPCDVLGDAPSVNAPHPHRQVPARLTRPDCTS
eukprot:4235587-Pyramimonas_sp.AAC.1